MNGDDLLNSRRFWSNEIPPEEGTGIYALFLVDPKSIPDLSAAADGLIYIGMTESMLKERNHFFHKYSSFSSPRRSLGALLREELSLTACPRGKAETKQDFNCYRFVGDGESRLSEWMGQNLRYSYRELNENIRLTEKNLILSLNPPLNLIYSKNNSVQKVKRTRAVCREEARLYSG